MQQCLRRQQLHRGASRERGLADSSPRSGALATDLTATQIEVTLEQVECDTLAGLDIVITQLDRILYALRYAVAELTESVMSAYDVLTASRLKLHRHVVSLIGDTGLPVTDLRLVAALLNVIPCVARMGEQCVIMAQLAQHPARPVRGNGPAYEAIQRMGAMTRAQVVRAKRVFAARDACLADDLLREDADLKRLGRTVFESALAARKAHPPANWGTLAMLTSRCLEHVGDEAVEIGEQGYLIVGDAFREIAYSS